MTPPGWGRTMGPCPTCEALARTIMLDQTSHDTKPFEWQGLTTDELKEIKDRFRLTGLNIAVAFRTAEAKLKEKNT